MFVWMRVCVCMFGYICVGPCLGVCMCVCVRVHAYVCVCVHACAYIHAGLWCLSCWDYRVCCFLYFQPREPQRKTWSSLWSLFSQIWWVSLCNQNKAWNRHLSLALLCGNIWLADVVKRNLHMVMNTWRFMVTQWYVLVYALHHKVWNME